MGQRAAAALPTPDRPRLRLTSVQQLESEIVRRRNELVMLVEQRDREDNELANARTQYARLAETICDLNEGVTKKNQAIFVLLNELDGLLQVRSRVRGKAVEVARRLKQEANAEGAANGAQSGPSAAVDPSERRAHPRAPLAVEVGLHSETNFYVGFSEDISQGGLFVATYQTRSVGERFPVDFALPGRDDRIRCLVEVAWVRECGEEEERKHGAVAGMGLRFIGITPEDRSAISEFMKTRDPIFFPDLFGVD